MKIAYICNTFINVAGTERAWTDKINYFIKNYDYQIYLITSSQGGHPFPFPLSAKVKHIDLNIQFHTQYRYTYPKRLWIKWQMRQDFIKKIKDTLSDIDPDIIIATTYWNADIVCNLKCRGKKIIESHCAKSHTNMNEFANTQLTKKIFEHISTHIYNRIVEKKCDALVALTRHDAKEWEKARCTVIIPNIIHQAIHPDNALNHRRVIAIGRLSYQKGFDRLIKAWETVSEKHPDWMLDIYGNGDYKKALQNQIDAAHMGNIITLHPATSDIFHEYATCSILALSSNYEGYGLTLIEAMSCGVPCVSFDCPYGPSEIIRNGTDGILVPNGDIEKMAQAICYLIENEKIRARYGQAAKENIKRLLPENIMPQWKQLFNQLTK